MSSRASGASAECTINLDEAGLDQFHAFLAKAWDDARQHIAVNPESEFAVTLMLGELLANAARHAYAGIPESERHLYIRLDVSEDCIQGELRDHGREFLNAEERLRAALIEEDEPADESGRGLRILASIADSVRYERTASGENVWFIGKCESPSTVVEGER